MNYLFKNDHKENGGVKAMNSKNGEHRLAAIIINNVIYFTEGFLWSLGYNLAHLNKTERMQCRMNRLVEILDDEDVTLFFGESHLYK